MQTHEKHQVLDLFDSLRRSTDAEGLRQWGLDPICDQHDTTGLPYAVLTRLRQYARCRGWALHFRRTGRLHEARREQGLASAQTRYFRSL